MVIAQTAFGSDSGSGSGSTRAAVMSELGLAFTLDVALALRLRYNRDMVNCLGVADGPGPDSEVVWRERNTVGM